MAMMFFIGFLVLFVGPWIWMLVIIFRRSVVGGLLTLFFGFPVFYFLVTGWGEEGKDIKLPFFLGMLPFGLIFVLFMVFHDEIKKDMDDGTISAPAERRASTPRAQPASVRVPVPAPVQAEPAKVAQPAPPAPVAQPAVEPAPVARPVAAARAPVQQAEAVKEPPRRPKAAQSNCVYKPVMTDEDMAKCR